MATIRVVIKDKNFKDTEIKRIQVMAERDTQAIAQRCEAVIRYTIENKAEGGTGRLANAEGWTAEAIVGGWGVGDIDKLNTENSYWRHINYGSVAIDANWEHILPKGYWANGRWVQSNGGYLGVMPKNPIPPMSYIESTLAQMEIEIPRILKER